MVGAICTWPQTLIHRMTFDLRFQSTVEQIFRNELGSSPRAMCILNCGTIYSACLCNFRIVIEPELESGIFKFQICQNLCIAEEYINISLDLMQSMVLLCKVLFKPVFYKIWHNFSIYIWNLENWTSEKFGSALLVPLNSHESNKDYSGSEALFFDD